MTLAKIDRFAAPLPECCEANDSWQSTTYDLKAVTITQYNISFPSSAQEMTARTSCGEIAGEFSLAQSTISQHLKILKVAGLIRSEVDASRTCYCLDPLALRQLRSLVAAL